MKKHSNLPAQSFWKNAIFTGTNLILASSVAQALPLVTPPPISTPLPIENTTGTTPPVPAPPVPTTPVPPSTPAPAPGSGTTTGFGDFQSITTWDIKLESVKIDRTGSKVEALFSFRNATLDKQFLSGSGFDLAVIDEDGVGRSQEGEMYRATSDERFPSTPVLAPNATIKARYFFPLQEGTRALRKLTLQFWRKDRLQYDISNVSWAKASTATAPTDLKEGKDFQALGENWDVRFDGWRKARDGGMDVFATFRNVTQEDGRLTYQTIDVAAQDAKGQLKAAQGTLYRVGGPLLVPITNVVIVPPDGEAKVRYHIASLPGLTPQKLTFTEGRYKKDTFEAPVTP